MRRSKARTIRSSSQPEKTRAEFVVLHRRRTPLREARRRRARSVCSRSASGATGCRSSCKLAAFQTLHGRGALLSEAARSVLRAVRQPARSRSRSTRRCRFRTPAGTPPNWREATGRFYTQGMPEDTKGLKTGVLHAGRVSGAGADRRRRGQGGSFRSRPQRLPRRPALLLLRQRRSGVAHDVAGAGSGASRPTMPRGRPVRARDRRPVRRPRCRSSARPPRRSARTICWS